jgi:hypothetical protein
MYVSIEKRKFQYVSLSFKDIFNLEGPLDILWKILFWQPNHVWTHKEDEPMDVVVRPLREMT